MDKKIDLSKIRTGDVINCLPRKTLLSRIISAVTGGAYSHTAIFLVLDGVVFVADSQIIGFTLKTFEEWTAKYGYKYDVYRDPFADEDQDKNTILGFCGIGYDFEGLVFRQPRKYWIRFTNKVRKYLGKPLKSEWIDRGDQEEGKRMYCSEVVMRIRKAPKWGQMSPQEAFDYQINRRYRFVCNNY